MNRPASFGFQLALLFCHGPHLLFGELRSGVPPQSDQELAVERANFENLAAITEAEFEASMRFNLVIENQPAGKVLRKLASQAGLRLEPNGNDEALDRIISLNLSKVSVTQAIDAVCDQIHLEPGYAQRFREKPSYLTSWKLKDGPPPLTLKQVSDPVSSTWAGPFVVSVEEVAEDPRYAVGSIIIRARSGQFPPRMRAFQKGFSHDVKIESMLASDETPLIPEIEAPHFLSSDLLGGILELSAKREIFRLTKKLDRIALVKGQIVVRLPREVSIVHFDSLLPDQEKTVRGLAYSLSGKAGNPFLSVGEPGEFFDYSPHIIAGEDNEGRFVPMWHNLWAHQGTRTVGWLDWWNGNPVKATLKHVLSAQELVYPFELRDIPLKRFNEMPETFIPLQFVGHQDPFTVEIIQAELTDGDERQSLAIRVINHSNKDLKRAEIYSFGAKTDPTFPANSSHSSGTGELTVGPGEHYLYPPAGEPLVKSGQSAVCRIGGFAEANPPMTLRFRVKLVECMDGEVWKNPDLPGNAVKF